MPRFTVVGFNGSNVEIIEITAPDEEYAIDAAYDELEMVDSVEEIPHTSDICTWDDYEDGLC